MLRKMALKKLRNLKWQQQTQRFIVNSVGAVDTFYDTEKDQEERKVVHRDFQLPKCQINHVLSKKKVPQAIYTYNQVSKSAVRLGQSTRQRCVTQLDKRSPSMLQYVSQTRDDLQKTLKDKEELYNETQNQYQDTFINMDNMHTTQLNIGPVVYKSPSPVRMRQSRMLESLKMSPLNQKTHS